jgi:hypothetical protein
VESLDLEESLGLNPITQPDVVTPHRVLVASSPPKYTSEQHRQAETNTSTGTNNANLQEFALAPDGANMWSGWTRNFNIPLLALLDLFDNAIDASLNVFEHSRRRRPLITAQADDYGLSGLVLRNSCVKQIPPLNQVLRVACTSSKSNSDSIGENGVGAKQAAASLSDLTFFMTRNGDVLELGFLLASLQQSDLSVVAPAHKFAVGVDLEDQLQQLARDHPTVYGEAFRVYGDGDVALGMDHLLRHFKVLTTGQAWKFFDHVFCVLIPRLRHGAGSQTVEEAEFTENDGDSYKIRTTRMLSDLAERLPYTYIHCHKIDIYVQKKKIDFHYWEKRLVELTEFAIHVDPKNIWHSSSYWKGQGGVWTDEEIERADTMRVFCGFDPQRASGKKSSAASLYIHSRASGRLIKSVGDARGALGLVSGSTDMCQGLTILLDDYEGTLQLDPTKQNISFRTEEHNDNLYAWVGGVAHFYWTMQMDLFGGLKSGVSKAVADCTEALLDEDKADNVSSFENGNFTRYEDVLWRNKDGLIRCEKGNRRKARKVQGMDSLVSFKVPDAPYDKKKPASKKRKANAMDQVRQEDETMINQRHHQSEIDRLNQQILEGEASRTQLLLIKDVQKKQIEELTAQGWEHAKQIEDLTAKGEEQVAAELVWRSKKEKLKQVLRESKNRVFALESSLKRLRESKNRVSALESESESQSPNHRRDQVQSLRRQLQMARDDCRMKEDLSKQAENQIQSLENLISGLKSQNELLQSHNQTLRRRNSNVYDDDVKNEFEEI